MDALIPFLKHSSALDLVIILLVVLIAVVFIPVGIGTVIASRSRKPVYFFLIIAWLPLFLALLGTYLRFRGIERSIAEFPEVNSEVVVAARQEAWITTYIGAIGTALLGMIGVTGLLIKRDTKAEL